MAVEPLKLKQLFYYVTFGSCFVALSVLQKVRDWTRPWHDILHDWNGRVNEFAARYGINLWSERCVQQHWDLARISSLGDQQWVKRLMQWQLNGRRRGGRPPKKNTHTTHTKKKNQSQSGRALSGGFVAIDSVPPPQPTIQQHIRTLGRDVVHSNSTRRHATGNSTPTTA